MKKFNGVWQPNNLGVQGRYTNVVDSFLQCEENWKTFKTAAVYNGIVGGDSQSQELGQAYVDIIKREFPYLIESIDKFSRNDKVGTPFIHQYDKIPDMSPGTLIYLNVIGNIEKYFGALSKETKVVEIGPGYGGQCIVMLLHQVIQKYTFIDLPQSLKVIEKYVGLFPDLLEKTQLEFYSTDGVPLNQKNDIAISNYCLTELDDIGINFYIDNVISHSNNCFIESNFKCTPRVAHLNRGRHETLVERLEQIFEEVLVVDIPKEVSGPYNVQRIIGRRNKTWNQS